MWETLLIMLALLLSSIYYFLTRNYDYWKKKCVPHLPSQLLFGNYKDYILQKAFIGNVVKGLYDKFPNEPYIGAFFGTEPTLIVQDPEFLKLIMVKDFSYFYGREIVKYVNNEAMTQLLFFNSGDRWKVIRQNLTPLFSSAKMKTIFGFIESCTQTFEKMLEDETNKSKCIETNMLTTRFLMDCVGSSAFGIDINLMRSDYENNPFKKMADMLIGNTNARGYKNILRSIWPKIFYGIGLQLFPLEAKGSLIGLVTKVLNLRDNKQSPLNDFADWILHFKEKKYMIGETISRAGESKRTSVRFDDEVIAGQCASFIPGSHETSATTLTLLLFELAKNEKCQLIAQKEVDEYFLKRDGKLGYDCLSEMPYLSACFDEILRLHPIFTNITREVMEGYTFPTGLRVDKGVRIHIPVYYLHRDSRNFADPDQFQPERFLPENKHKIKPFTYLPFGEGPRFCIGMRVARMQVFAGLITVLKNYNIYLANGMSTTVNFTPRMIISHTSHDVNLRYEPRRKASRPTK